MKKKITISLITIFGFIPDLFLKLFEKITKYFSYIFYESRKNKNLKSHLILEDKKIKLHLKKNDNQAHDVYRSLDSNNKIYELPLLSILINIINKKKYDIFLDLGSFMGYYPCVISKFFKNTPIKIHAIESNPEYCKIINKNLLENQVSNVIVHNEILSNKVENLFIYKECVYKEKTKKNMIQKTSITLDEFCIKNKISPKIIKIDVHGFEGKIFEGFKKIQECAEIILLELHPESFLKKFSNSSKSKIIKYLIDLNFNCFLIPFDNHLKIYTTEKNIKLEDYKNTFRKISEDNFDDLFFDKMETDNLILITKNNINLSDLKCFKIN